MRRAREQPKGVDCFKRVPNKLNTGQEVVVWVRVGGGSGSSIIFPQAGQTLGKYEMADLKVFSFGIRDGTKPNIYLFAFEVLLLQLHTVQKIK